MRKNEPPRPRLAPLPPDHDPLRERGRVTHSPGAPPRAPDGGYNSLI